MNAFSFLTRAADLWPTSPAIISPAGRLSFEELHFQAELLKAALFKAGIRPGMGLGLIAQNGPDFIVGLFAGLACGAVVMPISHNLKEQELCRILELVPMAGILHDGSLQHTLKNVQLRSEGRFQIAMRPKEQQLRVACGVPNAAVIRFTSGTTGTSKGVVLSHASVFERSEAARAGQQLNAGDKVLWVLPMAYHFIVSILTYVRYGITVVLPNDDSPSAILESAEQHQADLLYASPTLIQELASDESSLSFPSTTRIISTSSGLHPEHAERFERRFNHKVCQLYGLIEIGLPIGTAPSGSTSHNSDSTKIGSALPQYEVAILDDNGCELPPNHLGSLAVRGPGMFDAYLAPYRPVSDVLVNGWFITGDLAIQDYQGAISVCGREKSVINVAGHKVFPEEIEGVLNSFPGVQASRVYGVERPETGERVIAEVVPQSGIKLDISALRSYSSERLSSYKIPTQIHLVSTIQMTASGKILRAA